MQKYAESVVRPTGLEPVRSYEREILSLLRLPVSPRARRVVGELLLHNVLGYVHLLLAIFRFFIFHMTIVPAYHPNK